MTVQLVIAGTDDAALAPRQLAFMRAVAEAERHIRNRHSPRTRLAYATQWRHWQRYCEAQAIDELPIAPLHLVAHLSTRTRDQGAAPNSIRLALAALCVYDRAARVTADEPHPPSLYSHPLVEAWLDGWSRENPKRGKQAPYIRPRDLESVLLAAAERPKGASRAQHLAQYARDRAMLLIGISAALRVSEVVALNVADVTRDDRGLRVLVRTSKTDQHGESRLAGAMPQARIVRCPVDAWRAWLALRGEHDGPAFVGIERSGALSLERLEESSARKIVARRAAAIGLELTSHSMRATFATLAAEKGKPIHRIAEQGGWKSLDTLRGYIRQGELFDNNPSAGLLDD